MTDWIVRRAWERRDILPVKRLDPARDPFLASLMPDAKNVLVAPMIAEGRTLGAIVVEHRTRRTGVERRIAAMLGQFASIAALNLRNADPAPARPGPRRARLPDRRREPPDVPAVPRADPPRRRTRTASPTR